MKKKAYPIFLFILLVLFNGCSGYKPIFSSTNLDFTIGNYSIQGNKLLGNKIYSLLYTLSQSNKNNQNKRSIDLLIDSSKHKVALSKNSAGKILSYKITLNTKIEVNDYLTNKKILYKTFTSSLTYKIRNQYSETIELEKKTIDNLIEKTYQDLLISLTQNFL